MAIQKIRSKTIVIQPQQGIGNFMFYLPHIHSIAQRTVEKKVILLAHPSSKADIFAQNDPYIEKVIWVETHPGKHDGFLGAVRLAKLLESYKFEKAWILCSRSIRYGLSCWLGGIKKIYGPGHGMQKYFLTSRKSLTIPEQKKHPIERANLLLQKKNIPFLGEKTPLSIPESYLKNAQKKFGDLPKPWIGLVIGSSKSHKKWPKEHFLELADKLYKKKKGTIFIIADPQDKKDAHALHISLSERGINVQSVFEDLLTVFGLIHQLDFVVGNETGVTHGAPLVGTKALVLLGIGQDLIHNYTQVEGVRTVDTDEIRTEHENDLANLSPEKAFEKIKDLGWL
ncbi:MAG: glycosyltransferase family 9 protein [Alphaproteobacteria bacterium]